MTNEGQGRDFFNVKLELRPRSPVTIEFEQVNEQGSPVKDEREVILETKKIRFLTTNNDWKQWKSVRFKGVNDDFDDGDQKAFYRIIVRPDNINQEPEYITQNFNLP